MSKNTINYQISAEDEEIRSYFYERNKHLYACLQNGMNYNTASNIFGLTPSSIKTIWKIHKHKYPIIYYPERQGV